MTSLEPVHTPHLISPYFVALCTRNCWLDWYGSKSNTVDTGEWKRSNFSHSKLSTLEDWHIYSSLHGCPWRFTILKIHEALTSSMYWCAHVQVKGAYRPHFKNLSSKRHKISLWTFFSRDSTKEKWRHKQVKKCRVVTLISSKASEDRPERKPTNHISGTAVI